MNREIAKNKDVLIKIIEFGLKLWIRQICVSVEQLNLELNCSMIELINGKITEVKIKAKKVIFQDLPFEDVEIQTETINIDLGLLIKKRQICFKEMFRIKGLISFDSNGLQELFSSKAWGWVGESMASQTQENSRFKEITIKEEKIVLKLSNKKEMGTRNYDLLLDNNPGEVCFLNPQTKKIISIPMDPAINITNTEIRGEKLIMYGESQVLV